MKLTPAGATPEGILVVRGVYAFFETHGLPLSDMIGILWNDHKMLPSWVDLAIDMIRAGRSTDTAIEAITAAVRDACCYPPTMAQAILKVVEHRTFSRLVMT